MRAPTTHFRFGVWNVAERAVGENAEALPVADEARRFQGSGAIFRALSAENCNAATRASAGPYRAFPRGKVARSAG